MDALDIDANFEPQTRARSNTWPLPRPENYIDKDSDDKSGVLSTGGADQGQVPKKNSSRRNAWGNMSYADLISQAINSAPEKRLTLSQIYEWMVQNVPYFKDKGDSNSSAGWKNSIRHNLSLHSRFVRVQNEGTGKSSWWMINPDAKPGKAARRRAASMETKTYEKKRGRVKKKVEALRNGMTATPSPSSSVSEGLDIFPESPPASHFQLSPDFRPRASSNASSCSRLSPIPAVETDMHDNQAPPLSPNAWNSDLGNSNGLGSLYGTSSGGGLDRFSADQLVDSLAETMKLNTDAAYLADLGISTSPGPSLPPMGGNNFPLSSFSSVYGSRSNGEYGSFQSSGSDAHNTLPPLNSSQQTRSPQHILSESINGNGTYSLTNLQTLSPAANTHSLSPGHSMDTLTQPSQTQPSAYTSQQPRQQHQQQPSPQQQTLQQGGFCHQPPQSANSLQQRVILSRENHFHAAKEALAQSSMAPNSSASASLGTTATHVMNHLLSLNHSIPNDLDLNFDSLQGGLECDVDQVIRHELSVDGNLDFNFDPMNAALNASAAVPHNSTVAAARGNRTWVH